MMSRPEKVRTHQNGIEAITDSPEIDRALQEHLDDRCGFSKPAERDSRVPEIEPLLRDDLTRLAGIAG